MPLLDYKNNETGEVKEFLASPSLDNFTDGEGSWMKLDVPTSFSFGGQVPHYTPKEQVKGALRSAELNPKGWKSRYTKGQMKKVWDI
tara:strand:- start:121 stop:381 length:261 start_codon:yes stop_codon:yes gene_type:complete